MTHHLSLLSKIRTSVKSPRRHLAKCVEWLHLFISMSKYSHPKNSRKNKPTKTPWLSVNSVLQWKWSFWASAPVSCPALLLGNSLCLICRRLPQGWQCHQLTEHREMGLWREFLNARVSSLLREDTNGLAAFKITFKYTEHENIENFLIFWLYFVVYESS